MLIRSISGLRGLTDVPNGLTTEVVRLYAASFAAYCHKGIVAVGYDGRQGGKDIYDFVCKTLNEYGCDVFALGMVPTPTVMFEVENDISIHGGISVTASHNGQAWNGMKFIASSGLFLDKEQNESLWAIIDTNSPKQSNTTGSITVREDIIDKHINSILAIPFIDVEKIRSRNFKVVLDTVNASGSFIHPKLLAALGVTNVIGVATDGSGIFPHPPEPVPQNLTSLCDAVRSNNADIGIAIDPDADRCVFIMENGEPFIEENTIVIAAEEVLKYSAHGQHVVVNLSTTRAVEDIAVKFGAKVYRTPVGEINVARKMHELGSVIGGEGSGGVIYPEVHTGRDSLVAVALALNNLAASGMSLSQKKASLPQYEIVKSKIDLESAEQVKEVLASLRAKIGPLAIEMNETDGIRFSFDRKWLHVRASNTEPIIRLIAEARTKTEAQELLNQALNK